MWFTTLFCAAVLTATTIANPIYAANGTNTTYVGPESGHLVIVGGNLQSESIYQRIISLAGGPNASIVVVPTAGGEDTYDQNFTSAVAFRKYGANNVTVLHTYDPAVADTDEFIAPLLGAKGIFFGGGRQWRLVDAYAGTKTEVAFQAVLDAGGVISGSSAGASIIGSFLARGDTANNTIMIGDHTVGFGYLKNSAIDQHVLVRNRHFDMFEILNAYPELLGLAIDEDTALVVNKNELEVIGSTYALIYDGGFWSREGSWERPLPPPNARFYFLREGDKYDLGTRAVIEPETTGSGDDV
ncbi:class I glutamine amidotransferase-like protein [Alternaria alternata]|nr:class I glutamine amidotransferase-like protein [Alternaria alternata]